MILDDLIRLEPHGYSKMNINNHCLIEFLCFVAERLEDIMFNEVDSGIIIANYGKIANILDDLEFKTYGGTVGNYICIIFKNDTPLLIFKYKGSDRSYIGMEDYKFLSEEFYNDLCYLNYICASEMKKLNSYVDINTIIDGYTIDNNRLTKEGGKQ